jgi:hypothetical protein
MPQGEAGAESWLIGFQPVLQQAARRLIHAVVSGLGTAEHTLDDIAAVHATLT